MLENYVNYIKNLFPENSRIVVAMSGGVDSSVSAALIKLAGFETIGITLQLNEPSSSSCSVKKKSCCAGIDIKDAKSVAKAFEFRHYVLDYKDYFKEKVINNFVETYAAGKTPIPCGRCNQYVKFGKMLEFCKKIKADFLVTGHYIEKKDDHFFKSRDKTKDQSYFLALTTQDQFKFLQFPLANIEKTIVKQIAAELKLVVAKKPESQDICFIPDDYKDFLKKLRPELFEKGKIITKNNLEIGEHEGLAGYTIGQRKNLKLPNGPWFVTKINTADNTLTVGKIEDLQEKKFELEEINLLVEKEYFKKAIQVQVRARCLPIEAFFDPETNIITLNNPQIAIAPGQICALYDDERLLGGGIIKQVV